MKRTTVYKKLHFAAREMRSNIKYCFKIMKKETRIFLALFLPISIIWFATIVAIGFCRFYKKAGEIRKSDYFMYVTYVLD